MAVLPDASDLRSNGDQVRQTSSSYREDIDLCLKCTVCIPHCPVARISPDFPGPKWAGPELARFLRSGSPVPGELELCTGCRSCEMVCPNGVKVTELIALARGQSRSGVGVRRKGTRTLRDWVLAHSDLVGKAGTSVASLTNPVASSSLVRGVLDRALGIDHRRPLPRFSGRTFTAWARNRGIFATPAGPLTRSRSATASQSEGRLVGKMLAYFPGCYVNYYDPDLGIAVVEVLERNGFSVIVPDVMCCGLPLIANGFLGDARKGAAHNVETLRALVDQGMDIIFSSTSCCLTVKSDYPGLLDVPGADAVAGRARDISEFLLDLHAHWLLDAGFGTIEETVAYHAPCHLKAQGILRPAVDLLSLIPGLRLIELDAGCCGLAGTYGFKREKYEISMKVGKELFDAVTNSASRLVVTDCETCANQIEHGSNVPTIHPIKLIHRAYRTFDRDCGVVS